MLTPKNIVTINSHYKYIKRRGRYQEEIGAALLQGRVSLLKYASLLVAKEGKEKKIGKPIFRLVKLVLAT